MSLIRHRRAPIILRRILAVVAGAILTNLVILGFEAVAGSLFPYSLDIEAADRADLVAAMAAVPLGAEVMVAAGWFVGTMVGAAAALRLSQWRPAGWIVVVLVVAGGIWNLLQLPQPLWLQAATFVAPAAGGWLAEHWFHRARPGDPLIG